MLPTMRAINAVCFLFLTSFKSDTMIDANNICMMYRMAHSDKNIFSIIAQVHALGITNVKQILIDNKLMSPAGVYNAPMRLTGKEKVMDKKTNSQGFNWSPKRQQLLADMFHSGETVSEIAEHFNIEEERVYKGLDTYNITRKDSYKAHSKHSEQANEPVATKSEVVSVNNLHGELEELLHIITDCSKCNVDAMNNFATLGKFDHGYFELGQQRARLLEAERFIKAILKSSPEP